MRKGESAKLQLKRLDGSTVVKPVATYLVMPMATQRPQNLLPREQAVVVGEMVLFQTEDAGHFAIEKIIAVDGGSGGRGVSWYSVSSGGNGSGDCGNSGDCGSGGSGDRCDGASGSFGCVSRGGRVLWW